MATTRVTLSGLLDPARGHRAARALYPAQHRSPRFGTLEVHETLDGRETGELVIVAYKAADLDELIAEAVALRDCLRREEQFDAGGDLLTERLNQTLAGVAYP